MRSLADILEEYQFLDADERYRLLIELGRELDAMPDALKTDATKVMGCSASVWVYPTTTPEGELHFLADSNAAITKGIIALVLSAVQDQPAAAVAGMDVAAETGAVRPEEPAILESHPGRAQHDRVDSRACGATGGSHAIGSARFRVGT